VPPSQGQLMHGAQKPLQAGVSVQPRESKQNSGGLKG